MPAYTTGLTNNTVSFGEDSYGELYMVSQGTGRIYKFVSTAAGTIPLANADYDRNGVLAVSDIFTYLGDWFAGVARADYNRDGVLSVQDIFDFLSGWFNANLRTDFNFSGTRDVQDIFDFLGAWFAGC